MQIDHAIKILQTTSFVVTITIPKKNFVFNHTRRRKLEILLLNVISVDYIFLLIFFMGLVCLCLFYS